MEVTCAGCGYKAPISEFEQKASEVKAARKKTEEGGENVEPFLNNLVVCPKCGHDELLG